MTDKKKFQISTEYGSGFIRQIVKDLDTGEAAAVQIDLCDMQVQHALVALGWKMPKNRPSQEQLPKMKKASKATKETPQ